MKEEKKQKRQLVNVSYPEVYYPAVPFKADEKSLARSKLHEKTEAIVRQQWVFEADKWWLELCTRSVAFIVGEGEGDPMLWTRLAVEACPQGKGARYAACTDFGFCLDDCLQHINDQAQSANEYLTSETLENVPFAEQVGELGSEQRMRVARTALRLAFDVVPSVKRAMGDDVSLTEDRLSELQAGCAGGDTEAMLEASRELSTFCESVKAAVAKECEAFEQEVSMLEESFSKQEGTS